MKTTFFPPGTVITVEFPVVAGAVGYAISKADMIVVSPETFSGLRKMDAPKNQRAQWKRERNQYGRRK